MILRDSTTLSNELTIITPNDVSFDTVLSWLTSEWLTQYNNTTDFRWADSITRGEAAKFASQYASVIGFEWSFDACTFSDTAWYDSTLVPHIATACSLGILKWSNGMFMPNDTLTEAQAATLVIRTLFGFQDETKSPWYTDYFTLAQAAWLITTETMQSVNSTSVTREKLWTRFYLAAQLIMQDQGSDDDTSENQQNAMDDEPTDIIDSMDTLDTISFDITWTNFAFSQNTIEVREGQTVTINFESVAWYHDWVVDEFDAATDAVNPGTPTTVTFVADTAWEFEYYCSIGSHRANGMVGTLIVSPADEMTDTTNDQEQDTDTDETTAPQWFLPYNETEVAAAVAAWQDVVLYFAADRCPLCNALDANLEENADTIPDNVVIFRLDYDSETELKQEYQVISQHTLIYLDNDGNPYFDSVKTATTLEELLDEMMSNR